MKLMDKMCGGEVLWKWFSVFVATWEKVAFLFVWSPIHKCHWIEWLCSRLFLQISWIQSESHGFFVQNQWNRKSERHERKNETTNWKVNKIRTWDVICPAVAEWRFHWRCFIGNGQWHGRDRSKGFESLERKKLCSAKSMYTSLQVSMIQFVALHALPFQEFRH